MRDHPLSISETRKILDKTGISPRKHLGQNFLIDGNIVRKSLELAEIKPNETVIEVGPGLGTLTRTLLAAGARVYAVEKDPKLAAFLRENLIPDFPKTLSLLEGDAMEFPLAGFDPPAGFPFKIVANLPYAISSPWIDAVLSGPLPTKMVLMLQRETVDRLSAVPGTKQFGALTVFLTSAFEISRGHQVARQCFYPVPEIDSYLFHLTRLSDPFQFSAEKKQLIRNCFGQRRKQIGSLLRTFKAANAESWLQRVEEKGFSRKSRPEEIPANLWREL